MTLNLPRLRDGLPVLVVNTRTTSLPPVFDAKNDIKKAAQKLRFDRLKAARMLMPNERVAKCLWNKIAKYVEGWKSKTEMPGHFRKVAMCGSLCMCPVCAMKITERRKIELEAAVNAAYRIGWSPVLVTLTLRHKKNEKFLLVLGDLVKAIERLRGRKWWTRIVAKYEIKGSVTSLETTYGLSYSWHPHKHILFFVGRKLSDEDMRELQNEITNEYKKILKKLNRTLSDIHGVDVRGGDKNIADYIAKYGHEPKSRENKWTLAAEMTKAQQKNSLRLDGHYTPFQLLDFYLMGDVDAGAAFQEYARVMKGKKLLTWSKNLRAMLDLGDELSDEDIAAMNDEKDTYPFALFDGPAWRAVRVIPFEVLESMRTMDFQTFKDHMESLGVMIESDEFKTTTGENR